jgi:hypothetical protein
MWSSTWNVLDDARSTWNLSATLAPTPPDDAGLSRRFFATDLQTT